MHTYCLIGDPVDKSISHLSHNAVFKEQRVHAVYKKVLVSQANLAKFFQTLSDDILGLSVTMPLKEAVIDCLYTIDQEAKVIGSVNTIVKKNGRLVGYNTDGIGALDALEEVRSVRGKRLVLLGAGGAAKAIGYEATKRGAKIIILNRSGDKAEALAHQLGCESMPFSEISSLAHQGYDFLVNCTPVGMKSGVSGSPIPKVCLLQEAVIMDTVYNPMQTQLLIDASAKGCLIVHGYKMFINQAIEQFRLWLADEIDLKRAKKLMQTIVCESFA